MSNLSFVFHGAFSAGSPPPALTSPRITYASTPPNIAFVGDNEFSEVKSYETDPIVGTIQNAITLDLGDVYDPATPLTIASNKDAGGGALRTINGMSYSYSPVAGQPQQVVMAFSGQASPHQHTDDIDDLVFTFAGDFSKGVNPNPTPDISINFFTMPTASISPNFDEDVAKDDGSMGNHSTIEFADAFLDWKSYQANEVGNPVRLDPTAFDMKLFIGKKADRVADNPGVQGVDYEFESPSVALKADGDDFVGTYKIFKEDVFVRFKRLNVGADVFDVEIQDPRGVMKGGKVLYFDAYENGAKKHGFVGGLREFATDPTVREFPNIGIIDISNLPAGLTPSFDLPKRGDTQLLISLEGQADDHLDKYDVDDLSFEFQGEFSNTLNPISIIDGSINFYTEKGNVRGNGEL